MTKVIITLNDETSRFEAKDANGRLYYTAGKKADIKTSIKRSKKYDLEIVEAFEASKPVEEKPTTTKGKPAKTTYEDYKQHIITNFLDTDLHSKADKIANFCKKFNLTLNKAGRNLTFEKTLTKMVDDGIVEYLPDDGKAERKYKKLVFQYTDAHRAAMSPDEEEL